jgi:hypothetical protein
MGCLTTYGIGSAPPYYGTGYVPQVRATPSSCPPAQWGLMACFWNASTLICCSVCLPGESPAGAPALVPSPCQPVCALGSTLTLTITTLTIKPLQSKWYQFGFIFSVIYLAVWIFIGGSWWKVLGLW